MANVSTLKTAIVLGCHGQDGSFMCKSLLEKSFEVIGLSRKQTKHVSNHLRIGIKGEVEIVNGDK